MLKKTHERAIEALEAQHRAESAEMRAAFRELEAAAAASEARVSMLERELERSTEAYERRIQELRQDSDRLREMIGSSQARGFGLTSAQAELTNEETDPVKIAAVSGNEGLAESINRLYGDGWTPPNGWQLPTREDFMQALGPQDERREDGSDE